MLYVVNVYVLDMNSPIWYYVIATAIMGLGNALFQSPNNTMVMSSVEKQDLGVAGSMNSFSLEWSLGLRCQRPFYIVA